MDQSDWLFVGILVYGSIMAFALGLILGIIWGQLI